MNLSSGTILFLVILGISLGVLLILLIISSLVNKKKQKMPGGIKALTIIFAVIAMGASVTTPLVHYNYIPLNLRYGYFKNTENETSKIKITRDSVELHQYGGGASDKRGTYTLSNNILSIYYTDGTMDEFEVKGLGTDLYQNGHKVYSYLKDQGGLD